jgi:hypothetical protein
MGSRDGRVILSWAMAVCVLAVARPFTLAYCIARRVLLGFFESPSLVLLRFCHREQQVRRFACATVHACCKPIHHAAKNGVPDRVGFESHATPDAKWHLHFLVEFGKHLLR